MTIYNCTKNLLLERRGRVGETLNLMYEDVTERAFGIVKLEQEQENMIHTLGRNFQWSFCFSEVGL